MQDKSNTELFDVVYRALRDPTNDTARNALIELEGRMLEGRMPESRHGNLRMRLARVEEDLAAFRREHAGHSHELRPFALHTLAPTRGTTAPTPEQMGYEAAGIEALRANAENRAWDRITEWITSAPKNPEHLGSTYEVRTSPVSPGHGTDWDAAIWRGFWNEDKDALDSEVVSTKRGTSRLDVLAHLAAWCEEDMHPIVQYQGYMTDGQGNRVKASGLMAGKMAGE